MSFPFRRGARFYHCDASLNPFELGNRPLVADITGVKSRLRLEKNQVHFFLGYGQVLDAAGNDDEFTCPYDFLPVAELHAQLPLNHKKELIFMVVMVPHELALEFYSLHVAVIQLGDDPGPPVIMEASEFLVQIDCSHRYLLQGIQRLRTMEAASSSTRPVVSGREVSA